MVEIQEVILALDKIDVGNIPTYSLESICSAAQVSLRAMNSASVRYSHSDSFESRQAALPGTIQPSPTVIETLPGGHRVAYEEFGCSTGIPFFYFHDSGSSRLEAAFLHHAAKQHGYRLIAFDRPGIGWSSYYTNATAVDIARDVIWIADCLKIEQFGVLSLGSGGIFALTLSHLYPHRVIQFVSLAGVPGSVFSESGSRSEISRAVARAVPALVKFLVRCRFGLLPDSPNKSLSRLLGELSMADRKVVNKPLVRKALALDQQEMMRQGSRGLALEMSNRFRKLDFALSEVSVPTIIWQGRADSLSQRADCEFMASRLQSASFHRVSNGGHFFFLHSVDAVFARLLERKSASTPMAA